MGIFFRYSEKRVIRNTILKVVGIVIVIVIVIVISNIDRHSMATNSRILACSVPEMAAAQQYGRATSPLVDAPD